MSLLLLSGCKTQEIRVLQGQLLEFKFQLSSAPSFAVPPPATSFGFSEPDPAEDDRAAAEMASLLEADLLRKDRKGLMAKNFLTMPSIRRAARSSPGEEQYLKRKEDILRETWGILFEGIGTPSSARTIRILKKAVKAPKGEEYTFRVADISVRTDRFRDGELVFQFSILRVGERMCYVDLATNITRETDANREYARELSRRMEKYRNAAD